MFCALANLKDFGNYVAVFFEIIVQTQNSGLLFFTYYSQSSDFLTMNKSGVSESSMSVVFFVEFCYSAISIQRQSKIFEKLF